MNEIRQKAREEQTDKENIAMLNKLEKEIAFKKKKVDRHNEELKQWKIKISRTMKTGKAKMNPQREKKKLWKAIGF